jgi:hypothetical protein
MECVLACAYGMHGRRERLKDFGGENKLKEGVR